MIKSPVIFRRFLFRPVGAVADFANDLAISYISHLLRDGEQQKACRLATKLQKTVAPLNPDSIEKICRLTVRNDAAKMDDLGNFFQKVLHKDEGKLLKKIELDLLLEQGNAAEAYEKSVEYSKEIKGAFYQIDLFFAAFNRNDQEAVKKIYKYVSNTHGAKAAILDLSFAMTVKGDEKLKAAAEFLLTTNEGLTITPSKLSFFCDKAIKLDRTEGFERLLIAYYEKHIATLSYLLDTANKLCTFYMRKGRYSDAVRFEKTLRAANFTVDETLSKMFKRARNLDEEAQKREAIRAVEAAAD